MIIEMARVRILGPREQLGAVLRRVQDLGILHLAPPSSTDRLSTVSLTTRQDREQGRLRAALGDLEYALRALDLRGPAQGGTERPEGADLVRWVRLAWRVRRRLERLTARQSALEEERALIAKYQQFFTAFRALLENEARWPNTVAYHVLLKSGDPDALPRLRSSLAALIGDAFQVYAQALPTGETAVVVVVTADAAGRVERLLAEAGVREIPVPKAYGGTSLAEAIPRMIHRLDEIPGELDMLRREWRDLARRHGAELLAARAALHDRLVELQALSSSRITHRAFVLEGWVPGDSRGVLEHRLRADFGDAIVVNALAREEWASGDAPVVLRNPRLLRPFETLTRLLPLPRYGTIDPTPFVAVFFPAFFGLILGDVGYGVLLAILGLVLHARSQGGTLMRNVSEIIGPCALFSIIAGFLYGEFFGDLGLRWFGLRPLAFSREEALIPFLLLAVALGAVHILLGLGLGVAANLRQHPRHALGRGVAGIMVLLIILALLAAVDVLPGAFLTPAVIALLVAFPVLILLEGVVAPIELLSTLGNILSYARIMALGVASVMLAVVANRMVGALGSVVVGVVFALLFHLVNFAIALFSPTIHALRLHYVEFFGKFYSPGGVQYQPFGHWTHAKEPSWKSL